MLTVCKNPTALKKLLCSGLGFGLYRTPTMSLAVRIFIAVVCLAVAISAPAQSPYQSSADFAKYAQKLRESALLKIEPQVVIPTTGAQISTGKYAWKTGIVTTVFWVGESATANNPVPNRASSWDSNWMANYGGFDTPEIGQRRNYIPARFTPQLNPFYIALPYNDVSGGHFKAEARTVIPWFRQEFERDGKSICQNRWIAVRNRAGRTCYAQWSDCGPFRTDHWQYVFGNERPKPNLNQGAGLDISPAVRDFLALNATRDVTDWKFVDFREVPPGPWSHYGENNQFVQLARRNATSVATKTVAPVRAKSSPSAAPTVILH